MGSFSASQNGFCINLKKLCPIIYYRRAIARTSNGTLKILKHPFIIYVNFQVMVLTFQQTPQAPAKPSQKQTHMSFFWYCLKVAKYPVEKDTRKEIFGQLINNQAKDYEPL